MEVAITTSSIPSIGAIIPARGGSKGLPRKNIRPLASKPLLYYIIQAAKSANRLDYIFVSTEDDEIANYALSLGIEVLHRPPALAEDTSPTIEAIKHGTEELRKKGIPLDICVMLRPTSPLCLGQDIDQAIKLFLENQEVDSVVSVSPAIGIHPIRLKRIVDDGKLVDAYESEGLYPQRRQNFEQLYTRNGAIYVIKSSVIDGGSLWGSNCLAYVMPEERSININTEFQFKMAELLVLDRQKV